MLSHKLSHVGHHALLHGAAHIVGLAIQAIIMLIAVPVLFVWLLVMLVRGALASDQRPAGWEHGSRRQRPELYPVAARCLRQRPDTKERPR